MEQRLQKGDPIFPRLEIEEEVEFIKEQMQGSTPEVEEKKKKVEEKPEELKKLQLMIS